MTTSSGDSARYYRHDGAKGYHSVRLRVRQALPSQDMRAHTVVVLLYFSACQGWPVFGKERTPVAVSYTHLRAHETRHDLVCRLLLEKKKLS